MWPGCCRLLTNPNSSGGGALLEKGLLPRPLSPQNSYLCSPCITRMQNTGFQGATAALRSPSVMLEDSHNGCRPWPPEASKSRRCQRPATPRPHGRGVFFAHCFPVSMLVQAFHPDPAQHPHTPRAARPGKSSMGTGRNASPDTIAPFYSLFAPSAAFDRSTVATHPGKSLFSIKTRPFHRQCIDPGEGGGLFVIETIRGYRGKIAATVYANAAT